MELSMNDITTISPLRQRMIEDMTARQLGPHSQRSHIANIRRLVDQRPSYGREEPVNTKRVYRLMKKHGLFLQRHTGHRRSRKHDGKVVTLRPRWCSDALEFTCWNSKTVWVAFALDCHDWEIIGWLASTSGFSGEMVRDMMVQSVDAALALSGPLIGCSG
jgi:transposase InsO family protein